MFVGSTNSASRKNNDDFRWRKTKSAVTIVMFAATELLLMKSSVHAGWVDPDTHLQFRSIKPLTTGDNREYKLVFSDEFERPGRTFLDGDDPRWTALDKNDYTNAALHYYSSDNVKTENGALNISTILKTNSYKAFDEDTKKFYTDKKIHPICHGSRLEQVLFHWRNR